ncbi:hypothetical protein BX666DRAFT_1425995 [Dichotomocladium elegans]|nr:hypothetical protein BX666DRAFT_1425995 [Dichotomocladium elegans]
MFMGEDTMITIAVALPPSCSFVLPLCWGEKNWMQHFSVAVATITPLPARYFSPSFDNFYFPIDLKIICYQLVIVSRDVRLRKRSARIIRRTKKMCSYIDFFIFTFDEEFQVGSVVRDDISNSLQEDCFAWFLTYTGGRFYLPLAPSGCRARTNLRSSAINFFTWIEDWGTKNQSWQGR